MNHLSELKQHMNISALPIPSPVREYDKKQNRLSQAVSTTNLSMSSWVATQQFGVTLEWIIDNQQCTVPPIMVDSINFLQQPDCLETEGIFRQVTWLPGQMTVVVLG